MPHGHLHFAGSQTKLGRKVPTKKKLPLERRRAFFKTQTEKKYFQRNKMESLRFAQSGVSIIELLNKVLVEKSVLEKLVRENNVERVSSELPGLIVQGRVHKPVNCYYYNEKRVWWSVLRM